MMSAEGIRLVEAFQSFTRRAINEQGNHAGTPVIGLRLGPQASRRPVACRRSPLSERTLMARR